MARIKHFAGYEGPVMEFNDLHAYLTSLGATDIGRQPFADPPILMFVSENPELPERLKKEGIIREVYKTLEL